MDDSSGQGKMVVFASPSGGGKSTIIEHLMKQRPTFQFSVSSTTRPPRDGEIHGVHYDFLTDEKFRQLIEEGDFLEFEDVHGKLYGTRLSKTRQLLSENRDIIFDVDVLGALSIQRAFPNALLIYIDVPSREELRRRLENRGTDSRKVSIGVSKDMILNARRRKNSTKL